MANLGFKTRGNQDPKGLPRVYFSCHTEDYDIYFEKITNEILEISNCAIYYYEPKEKVELDEEYYLNLERMNLFVVPVTTKYLTKENRAYDVEFKFAIDHNIPVLPLMQEGSLNELFAKKCGDLQYLDPNSRDSTAISYNEKLKKYLQSVLIGDELAKQIRKAFDAYIFLSYRKKDRKFAQELMKLIHQNDFCRDIAIWYDEFLTPGESFNNAIEEALKKSALFALAVTPNLVNEKNYVMRVEYPKAVEHGKKILPAEMVKTDGKALKENYKGIPEATDAHDEESLSKALIDALETVAKRENDNDPQHNFFIGLAYLGGIDVEIDHKRAVSLITSAAEAGLLEAMEKLGDMYHSGEGVPRDYLEEIGWLERIVEKAKKEFENKKSEYNAEVYFNKLWKLGDAWYALGQIEKAKAVYEKMLDAATVFESDGITQKSKRDLSVSYNKLGDISLSQGNLEKAESYYFRSLEIREQLARETSTVESKRDLLVSYNKLGDISKSQGDFEKADSYYERLLKISEQLVKETSAVESKRDLSVSYNKLGDISLSQGNLEKAESYYFRSLEIRDQLAKEMSTIESKRDLSISYEKLGNISKSQGDLEKAESYYFGSLETREQLVRKTSIVESKRDLSVSYNKLGDIYKSQGDFEKADSYYVRSLEISEQLVKETSTVESKRDLSVSYNKLGDIYKSQGDLEKAESYYVRSLEISEQLAKETSTVESKRDLSISYDRLGDICASQCDFENAERYYERSLEIAEQLAKEMSTIESKRDLSISYENLGDICASQGDLEKAESYYVRSLEISEQLAKEVKTPESYNDLAVSYYKIAMLYNNLSMLQKAYQIYDMLCQNCSGASRYVQNRNAIKQMINKYSK